MKLLFGLCNVLIFCSKANGSLERQENENRKGNIYTCIMIIKQIGKNLEIVTKYRKILWLYSGYQYQLTESGKTCSNISLNATVDEGECKKAAEDLGLSYVGTTYLSNYPSGCFAYRAQDDARFNTHESGSGNGDAKSICKQGVYQFINNQSLSKLYYFEFYIACINWTFF